MARAPRATPSADWTTSVSPDPAAGAEQTARRVLAAALEQAQRRNRTDLVERLHAERDRLDQPKCTVLVVGEFNKRKSSLVNALLNA